MPLPIPSEKGIGVLLGRAIWILARAGCWLILKPVYQIETMCPKDALDLQARPAYPYLIFFQAALAFAAPHAIDGRVRIAPGGHV